MTETSVNPFPCGGNNEPACPPQPAAVIHEPAQYTLTDMKAHGSACYLKGKMDERMTPHAGDDGPLERLV